MGDAPAATHRSVLMNQYADNMQDITLRINKNKNENMIYCGLKRFMMEEQPRLAGESYLHFSRNASELARAVYQRSQAYSRLVAEKFPDAFRLTIHPHEDWVEKTPIRLIPSSDRWATLWHNVAVYNTKDNKAALMHRNDAERNGFTLHYKDGKPWRYEA